MQPTSYADAPPVLSVLAAETDSVHQKHSASGSWTDSLLLAQRAFRKCL